MQTIDKNIVLIKVLINIFINKTIYKYENYKYFYNKYFLLFLIKCIIYIYCIN